LTLLYELILLLIPVLILLLLVFLICHIIWLVVVVTCPYLLRLVVLSYLKHMYFL
ncbi:unnamed protein product, partial (mitochondrion) [Musa acuminata var. zebrina]